MPEPKIKHVQSRLPNNKNLRKVDAKKMRGEEMRLIDADRFKENILSGLYIYCQENKEDIARAIDDEPIIEPDLKLFKEWKCADCVEREKSFYDGWQSAKERFERPQGEWIKDNSGERFCSVCGRSALYHEIGLIIESRFCPACGADLRGENNG